MYSGGDSLGAIVVDAGSYSFRVGYAGDDFPRAFVRSSFGEPVATGSKSQKSPNLFDTDLLSNSKENVVMCNPMRDGLIYDWDHFEKLWEYCLTNYVKVDCAETPVLMAEKSYNTPACRHKTCEFMFETLKVPALFLGKDAALSCYATGRTTGVCVDFGYSGCNISPVVDGYVDARGLNRSAVGGQLLDAYAKHVLAKLVDPDPAGRSGRADSFHYRQAAAWSAKGVSPSPTLHAYLNLELFRSMRESLCTRILGTDDFPGQTVFSLDASAAPSAALAALQNTPATSYELPDGKTVQVGVERFVIPEVICDPGPGLAMPADADVTTLGGGPSQAALPFSREAIPYQILDSILKADTESSTVNALFGNLVYAGGASATEGLSERIKFEIEKLVGARVHHLAASIPPNMRIRHYTPGPKEQNIAAWLGGSILGSLSGFHDTWISKAEYEERGSSIVDKKCP